MSSQWTADAHNLSLTFSTIVFRYKHTYERSASLFINTSSHSPRQIPTTESQIQRHLSPYALINLVQNSQINPLVIHDLITASEADQFLTNSFPPIWSSSWLLSLKHLPFKRKSNIAFTHISTTSRPEKCLEVLHKQTEPGKCFSPFPVRRGSSISSIDFSNCKRTV